MRKNGILILLLASLLIVGCEGSSESAVSPSQEATNQETVRNLLAIVAETRNDSEVRGESCDDAYPDVCIPLTSNDLDCIDIEFRNFVVQPPDQHNFDRDNDGIGCEDF